MKGKTLGNRIWDGIELSMHISELSDKNRIKRLTQLFKILIKVWKARKNENSKINLYSSD